MNCLKDLKDGQDGLKNDFSNLDDKYKLIEKKL